MADFIVTYDLRKARDYPKLTKALEDLNGFRTLRSAWLLSLEDDITARDLKDHLQEHIDTDDGLFVAEFSTRPAAYKCRTGTSDWLKEHYG